MMENEDRHLFREFFQGLYAYMKKNGRFAGQPIAPDWQNLNDQEKDEHVAHIFVTHIEYITLVAHNAITNEKKKRVKRKKGR